MKKKSYLFIVIFVLLVVILSIALKGGEIQLNSDQTNLPNPSAVYCVEQGYRYETITEEDGSQIGVCKLTLGLECKAWDFFNGKCGQEYTYCEKHGGKIETVDTGCSFSSVCAVCVLTNGKRCYEWNYFKGECNG